MRKMKDSGIEWIGDIPEGWEVRKIGNCYAERNIKVSDKDYPPLSVTKKGILPQLESAAKTDNGDNRKLICIGDFVINSRSDRKGSCGISQFIGSTSLINIVIIPQQYINNNYFSLVFKTTMFADEFFKWGNGIVDDLWSTKWSNMKKISIPFPPLSEQQRIADYLDAKCARIDETAELVRQSMEKLRAYRLSLITGAVTKGLDPNVPMKDSGIPWIGEIPKGWEIGSLGKYVDLLPGFAFPSSSFHHETGIKLLRGINLGVSIVKWDDTLFYNNDIDNKISQFVLGEGDLIIGMDRPWIANGLRIVILKKEDVPSLLVQRLCKICSKKIIMKFVYYTLLSDVFNKSIAGTMSGISVPHISASQIANCRISVPPLAEQQRIADYLDAKCARIDALLEEKERLLERLAEYKKSLIFECVTGKREVSA